jgi:hypothetical protein
MVYPTIGPSSTVTGVLFTSGCFFVLILLILIPFFTRIKTALYPLARLTRTIKDCLYRRFF